MNIMISVEIENIENHESITVSIYVDMEGIRYFSENISALNESKYNHFHLMTPSWGGNELSEVIFKNKSILVNHVCVTFAQHEEI